MGRADSPGCKSHLPICWGAGVVISHLITLASIVAQRDSSATAAYHRSIVFSQVTSAESYLEWITYKLHQERNHLTRNDLFWKT